VNRIAPAESRAPSFPNNSSAKDGETALTPAKSNVKTSPFAIASSTTFVTLAAMGRPVRTGPRDSAMRMVASDFVGIFLGLGDRVVQQLVSRSEIERSLSIEPHPYERTWETRGDKPLGGFRASNHMSSA